MEPKSELCRASQAFRNGARFFSPPAPRIARTAVPSIPPHPGAPVLSPRLMSSCQFLEHNCSVTSFLEPSVAPQSDAPPLCACHSCISVIPF